MLRKIFLCILLKLFIDDIRGSISSGVLLKRTKSKKLYPLIINLLILNNIFFIIALLFKTIFNLRIFLSIYVGKKYFLECLVCRQLFVLSNLINMHNIHLLGSSTLSGKSFCFENKSKYKIISYSRKTKKDIYLDINNIQKLF